MDFVIRGYHVHKDVWASYTYIGWPFGSGSKAEMSTLLKYLIYRTSETGTEL